MVGYISRLGIDLRAREILISRFGDRLEKEKEGKKKFWNWETEREKQRKEFKKKLIYKTTIIVYIYMAIVVTMYFYTNLHGLMMWVNCVFGWLKCGPYTTLN